jgi:hypothetical protein
MNFCTSSRTSSVLRARGSSPMALLVTRAGGDDLLSAADAAGGLIARMVQLGEDPRAVLLRGGRQAAQAGDEPVLIGPHLHRHGLAQLGLDRDDLRDDQSGAARARSA